MDALLDEMYDGFDDKINGLDLKCRAYSVKKLLTEGHPLKTDYSVISYVKDNNMVLITEDVENGKACKENSIPYILIDSDVILDAMVEKLKNYC